MRIKSVIEDLLRNYPPLFRMASQAYHRMHGSFRTLSPGAPGAIRKAFELINERDGEVSGDYYEFGLFRGYTFLQAYNHCRELGLDSVNFYGFDSFEGLHLYPFSRDDSGIAWWARRVMKSAVPLSPLFTDLVG